MTYLAVAVAAVLIGLAKAGFAGLAMMNTPLLTTYTSAGFAIGVTLPLLVCGDLIAGWRFWGKWNAKIVLELLPGALVGILLGTPLLTYLSNSKAHFNRAIGVIALSFSVLQLILDYRKARGPEQPLRPAPKWQGFLAGMATGVVSTLAHQGGVVTNLYLLSQGLTKETFAGTAMLLYFVINLMKVGPYLGSGQISAATIGYSLAAAPFVLLGVLAGELLLKKLNPQAFARLVIWLTIIMGAKLIIWPV